MVTVTGANFVKTTAVSFGGHPAASFTILNDRTLTAVSPPGTGTVDITVVAGVNPSPSVQSDRFTYVLPPTVTSVSPVSGWTTGGRQCHHQGN